MSNFQGEYLRIRTPVTIDGKNIKYDLEGKVIYKETHLPLTARKSMEMENLKLPTHLRHKIELAGGAAKPSKV